MSSSNSKQPRILNPAFLDFASGTIVLDQWSAEAIARVLPDCEWSWDDRTLNWRTMAIVYAKIKQALAKNAYGTLDRVPQWQTVAWTNVQLHQLRAEQSAAVTAWSETGRGVVVMPTGTGKTEVALRIMADHRCSALVVAPIRDLMYQWHRRIQSGLSYDAGIIGDSLFNVKPISVTTYDSACIHMPTLGNRFQLIVFDECHHLCGPMRSDAARMCAAPMRLGLTATPERGDGLHAILASLIGPIVYRLEIHQVSGKSLAEYDVVRIPIHLNDDERNRYDTLAEQVAHYVYDRLKTDPSFEWKDLCSESLSIPASYAILKAHREKQSIEDRAAEKLRVLEDLFRLHAGTPILVFAGSNAMARDVSLRFLIPCLLSHCGKAERLDYLNGLQDGTYPAIVANQVLDEGVDIPEVKIAIVIGGMASSRQAKQRLGRILRKRGNDRAILYEVVAHDTNETVRSRKRRKNDAYTRIRHRQV